jgi:DNA gyrase/topoisomerase IV subunit A
MVDILKELHEDFITYAKEVNENRAFPDARDGLKPSARACLWEMFIRGYTSNKPHVKSAKVDGGVIANWHPHGSEYSTFVRMSQPWINNIPEVDWHGANGSQLGGPEPAAARYTECRLSTASEDGFFTNIKKNTIDMIPNFSEDDEWPIVFPAIFPRLFVNGSQGIGYTIAQEWELGNLKEFTEKVKQYLKKKKITCDDIYPDYPTAGIIINKKDIHTIYETGKGSVVLRGKSEIDGNLIKITSLPYQVYVEPFIASIKDLVNEGKLTGIEDIYNKSDDNGMLIEIECSEDPNLVLNSLFKLTDLQYTFSANQMALVNGKPELLTLEDYIRIYIEHNIECIKREYQFDLDKANSRKEIVDGLVKALGMIDSIISTIKKSKSSEEAKKSLVSQGFTSNQAQAIVDMRLGKLANLEQDELNKEQKELIKKVSDLTKVINSSKTQEKEFLKRLEDFTSRYGWERRTEVTDIDFKTETKKVKTTIKNTEQVMVLLNSDSELKKVSLTDYRELKNSNIVKSIKVGLKDKIILISNLGKMYKIEVNKIPKGSMKSSGKLVSELITLEPNEFIIDIFSGKEEDPYLFFITDKANVKKVNSEEIFGISKKSGTPVFKLKEESLLEVFLVNDNSVINLITSKPKEYQIKVSDFNTKSRKASGVRSIKLKSYTLMETSLLN